MSQPTTLPPDLQRQIEAGKDIRCACTPTCARTAAFVCTACHTPLEFNFVIRGVCSLCGGAVRSIGALRMAAL